MVEEDDDGDGIIESGEDVKFKVKIKNTGNANAVDVFGQFDPVSQANLTDEENFPDLGPGDEQWSNYSFRLYDIPRDFSGPIDVNLKIYYGDDGRFVDETNPYTFWIQPTPYIYLTPREYDFGVKSPDSGPVNVPFTITNTGTSPLHVSGFSISHPADTTILGSVSTIMPGETVALSAEISISGYDGIDIERTIQIVSDTHQPAKATLWLY